MLTSICWASATIRAWAGDFSTGPADAGRACRLSEGRNRQMVAGHQGRQHQAGVISVARLVVVSNFLDQLNDGPPHTIMINSRKCLQQPIGMWSGKLVKNRLL